MPAAASPFPRRIAGNLALDFANTISWRGTSRERDHLADAGRVLAWAVDAGLIGAANAVATADRAALLADLHALRAAIQRIGAAVEAGEPLPAAALATLRRLAARSLGGATFSGRPLRMVFRGPDLVVGPLAWSFLDLLRSPQLERLKQCPAPDCHWLFLDETKNRSRRWCDMGTCGNRVKKSRSGAGTHGASSS